MPVPERSAGEAPGAEDHSGDVALLNEAARAAGEIARRHFGRGPASWEKEAGQGPVSEADLEIDLMLRDRLLSARPGFGWLSEETEDDPARLAAPAIFIVDPITQLIELAFGIHSVTSRDQVVDQQKIGVNLLGFELHGAAGFLGTCLELALTLEKAGLIHVAQVLNLSLAQIILATPREREEHAQ